MVWWLFGVATVIVVIVLLPPLTIFLRRRWIVGKGSGFDCAYLPPGVASAGGWFLGLAKFRGENFEWYRVFSLSLRPRCRFRRGRYRYVKQRAMEEEEIPELFHDSRIVTIEEISTKTQICLAMDRQAAVALMSWLEAAPPCTYLTFTRD